MTNYGQPELWEQEKAFTQMLNSEQWKRLSAAKIDIARRRKRKAQRQARRQTRIHSK